MKYTAEQEMIISAAASRQGSAMVQAGAGCAKTSTGKAAMGKIKVPGLALAFNAKIAKDLSQAMPASFTSKSFNALGHMAWQNGIGIKLKLEERKLGKLVTDVSKELRMELDSDQWSGLRQMVELAMQNGLVPSGDKYQGWMEDSAENWIGLGLEVGLDKSDAEMLAGAGREILVRSIQMARAGIITFSDQVYCSVMLGGKFTKYPVVFVDEAQDLARLNIAMARASIGASSRLFVVGDRKQAIYAWRGASGTSMDDIRQVLPESQWSDYPLLTTFRCPKEVVARQQEHIPGYRAWHTNPDGLVVRLPMSGESWTWDDLVRLSPAGGAEISILCRNNAPLVGMALKLLRSGIGCYMQGRDIGKGLVSLSKKLAPDDGTPRDQVMGKVMDWEVQEISLAQVTGRLSLIEQISDKAAGLLAVLENGECRTAGDLRICLGRIFARESGQVCLSSIHRAKGLEWDMVVHLDPWRIPSKFAKGNPVAMEQERNLKYVCETRTKHTLVLANMEDFVL